MREDTPPSSISGDEIVPMDDEIYVEEVEEVQFDNDDMEMYGDPELMDEFMEPPPDLAKTVFRSHNGSVFCCDIHPNGKLAVSGGEDDSAYVWCTETGREIFCCTGHKDSVVLSAFSFDGYYLATGDMAGLVKVWKVHLDDVQQPWEVVFEQEVDDLSYGMWHSGARVLICGTLCGNIFVYKIPSGETKILTGQNEKAESAKLFSDGIHLAAGYENGVVKVWNLKTCAVVSEVPGKAHGNDRVTAVDVHPDDSLVISISTQGKVIMSTATTGKIVGQLDGGSDLETVAFSRDPAGFFALGTLCGGISIWDVPRQMIRHQCSVASGHAEGVTSVTFVKNHLVAGLLDGTIRVYESMSGKLVHTFTGHSAAILSISYNSHENLLLSTSDDDTARLFEYEFKTNE